MVRSPLTAARATFALKAGEWFRRGRLLMVSPVHGDYRRCQAEIPLIVLFRFPGPALPDFAAAHESGSVQVFGRRDADTIHALLQPASKKRQGTKSREVCGQRVPRALWGFCRRFGLVEVGLKRSPRSACGEPWWHASV